jgi:DNA-binding NtrC family response regulator
MKLFNKLRQMKILLIDDDEWIRDSLGLYFEDEGCHLHALETAEEGIEALKGENYDIIMVDYRLPGMDGLEFLKRIQKTQSHAMKVLVTAYKSKGVVSKAMKIGIDGFIEKPFTTKTIEESLSRVIENHKQEINEGHINHS